MSLSDTQRQLLLRGIDEIGLVLSDESLNMLELHLTLVQKWRSKINLISIANEAELISHHALDSLVIAPFMGAARRVLDFGTGAGFPGMQLATIFDQTHFTLLDSRQRRIEFLRMVGVQAGMKNIALVSARVESFSGLVQSHPGQDLSMQDAEKFDTLVVRAVASLAQLVKMTSRLRCKGQRLLAMKGQYPQAELDELAQKYPDQIDTVKIEPLLVPGLDAERHLVIIEFSAP